MIHCSADFKQTVERDIRFLNVEVEALGNRVKSLKGAFDDSKQSVNEFHDSIKKLYELGGNEDGVYTLRETLQMQKYYRALLRQELQVMNKLNRSWWTRFKEYLTGPGK